MYHSTETMSLLVTGHIFKAMDTLLEGNNGYGPDRSKQGI